MKKIILLFALVFISASFSISETYVYICKGKHSKKYHYNDTCRGLNRCSTKTYKVTLKHAKNIGRTLCGHED